MILIESVERDEIDKWCRGVVQVLYQKEEDSKVLSPGSAEFRVKPTRFYTEGSYKNSSLMEGKGIVVSLLPLSAQTSILQAEAAKKVVEPVVNKAKEVKPKHIIEEHKTNYEILHLKDQNQINQIDKKRIRAERNVTFGLSVFVVVVLLGLLIFFRMRARKNRIIAAQKIQKLEDEKKLMELEIFLFTRVLYL